METMNRLLELDDRYNSFFFSLFDLFILPIGIISFLLLLFTINECVNEGVFPFSILIGIFLTFIGSLSMFGYIATENTKMLEEMNELEKTFFATLETATVSTTDIKENISVRPRFCPHMELKENETCTYLEFVSEGEISQILIPLEQDVQAIKNNELTFTYYSVDKKQRKFLNEYFGMKKVYVNKKQKIDTKGWAFGVSIDN